VQVVVGHANPDFDAYASTVAATRLFPGARGVFLGTQNANVRSFHNLHEEFLSFVDAKEIDPDSVDSVIMVDTRDPDRVAEFRDVVLRPDVDVIVYDHHPAQEGDIEGADDRSVEVGATTSVLVHEIRSRGIELTPLEASLMLIGIHEDTGSLTYPGSTAYDADAAAWLMAQGADLEVVNQYLSHALTDSQRALLGQLEDSLETWTVNGQHVAVGVAIAEEYVDSASVLTHYIVEDLGYRVAIAVISMPQRLHIVARSRLAEVDVAAVLSHMGGGGHAQAASAGFRDMGVDEALVRIREALALEVKAPMCAADVMTAPVRILSPKATMAEAGETMSRWGHGGVPIVEKGQLVGLVTRKDVDKALRHSLDHAPVTGFMTRDPVTVAPDMHLPDVERLLARRGIGRLPVVEDGKVVGIVTRKDVLRAEHGASYLDRRLAIAHPRATQSFLAGIDKLLPEQARAALEHVGRLAVERGERAHVVGGFVRDMILGRPNMDIDVVVEGDGVAFAEALAEQTGVRVRAHLRFGTAVLVFGREFHLDVASSRTEYYARPGALPTVEPSTLRQDLFRRDFTINAMAACLDPECFGRIADPFGGLRDMDEHAIRALHALSFVDDPTRVLRAARFEARYGFEMDAPTASHATRAVEMGLLRDVSGARVREELLDILDEPDPAAALRRLDAIGALAELVPDGVATASAVKAIKAAEDAIEALGPLFPRALKRRVAYVSAIAAGAGREAAEHWIRHFRFGREYAEAAVPLAVRAPAALRALQDRRGMRDSRLYHALEPLTPEGLVGLWSIGDALARERIERFAQELRALRPAVTGHDLVEMGAAPGEGFSAILARARDDVLDGRVRGRDAELANLRRLALKAGLIGPRKDPA
jgi:tRNA nucleotidyltransferase (CCA-adding enzyme)